MKRFILMLGFTLVALLSALSSKAQTYTTEAGGVTIFRKETCTAQECLLNWWNPIRDGDTLVVIIRPIVKQPYPICWWLSNCGTQVNMVTDNYGNLYQHAYEPTRWFDRVFVAFNVKGRMQTSVMPPFVIGVVTSVGVGDYGHSTGGYFDFDVLIIELPPTTGFAATSASQGYFNGGGSNTAKVYPGITLPNPGKTILLAWSVLRWYGTAPMHVTYLEAPWSIVHDDGLIAAAAQEVTNMGTYDFEGTYDNYGFWDAGIVALTLKQ